MNCFPLICRLQINFMKQVSLVLSVIATLISGYLLVKSFDGKANDKTAANQTAEMSADKKSSNNFRIAYFDIDTLQQKYEFFKDALAELKVKEDAMNKELASMERTYQGKISEWQKKGSSMSQSEADAVQREYAQMQQNYQQRRLSLEQQLENL